MSRTKGMQAFCMFVLACGVMWVSAVLAHTQLGSSWYEGNIRRSPISLSGDGQRLAVGGRKVYKWSGSSWQQLGTDLPATAISGSLSADGNRIAITCDAPQPEGLPKGCAQVFEWSGSAWQQLGMTIMGVMEQDGWELLSSSPSWTHGSAWRIERKAFSSSWDRTSC